MAVNFPHDSVPPEESQLLKPVRFSVTNIVENFLESLAEAERNGRVAVARVLADTTSKYRSRIMISYVLAFSACVIAAASGYRVMKDGGTIQSLQNAVLARDLQNIRLSLQGHSTNIDSTRTATYATPEDLTLSRRNLLSTNSELTIQSRRIQQLEAQTRRNHALHQEHLQLSGLVNRLQVDTIALLESMSLVESDLRTAQSNRSEQLRTNPLALAAAETRARSLPCNNDALLASCSGPLEGIVCYAFTPPDPRRAHCELVKPRCRECNLPAPRTTTTTSLTNNH
ncbi:hypothetical protein KA517_04185 [Candidatus Gracilibacteria bacterium]|nr:hypothetical protein [Candidatus Gracilibacteria bacterium]